MCSAVASVSSPCASPNDVQYLSGGVLGFDRVPVLSVCGETFELCGFTGEICGRGVLGRWRGILIGVLLECLFNFDAAFHIEGGQLQHAC